MSYLEFVSIDHDSENALNELARTNHFTMADLESNRQGKISDQQWSRLLSRALDPIRYPGGALAGWLVFCFVVSTFVPRFVLMIVGMIGAKSIYAIFLVVTLTCAGSLLVSALKSGRSLILLMADLKAGKAACLEGRVSPSREDEGGLGLARLYGEKHTNRWYVIQHKYFAVDEEACAALPPGGRYRLYYTPKSKLLLSIEPA